MTRDEQDEIYAAVLEVRTLLKDNTEGLHAITEEVAQLRRELAEFRAVVDEVRAWAGVSTRQEPALLQ